MSKKVRILPYLLRSGHFKDSHEVVGALREGRVKIGSRTVFAPHFEFRPSTEAVTVDGKEIVIRKQHLTIMLNKPEGVLCQKNDAQQRPNVWTWLAKHSALRREEINALLCVGRLDIDTEGLLVMTTDGELANRISQPQHSVQKTYEAIVQGNVHDASLERLRKGVEIILKEEGGRKRYTTRAVQVRVHYRTPKKSMLSITITEGKKRQVRLMCTAIGHEVLKLRRVAIGKLMLGAVPVGKMRVLQKEEVQLLDPHTV